MKGFQVARHPVKTDMTQVIGPELLCLFCDGASKEAASVLKPCSSSGRSFCLSIRSSERTSASLSVQKGEEKKRRG